MKFRYYIAKQKNYVFSGWEILSGDSTVEFKNGFYVLTVGNQDTIIRAIWKTEMEKML